MEGGEEELYALVRDRRWTGAAAVLKELEFVSSATWHLVATTTLSLMKDQHGTEASVLSAAMVERDPERADAHLLFAEVLFQTGHGQTGLDAVRRGLALRPDGVALWRTLGVRLKDRSLELAEGCFLRALSVKNDDLRTRRELAQVLAEKSHKTRFETGAQDAFDIATQAVSVDPDCGAAWSARLFARQCLDAQPSADLFRDSVLAGRAHSKGITPLNLSQRDLVPPLKIGLRAFALHDSSVRHFLRPFMQHHDQARVSVTFYDSPSKDASSGNIGALPGIRLVETRNLDDAALADHIRRDKIDVLVDLIGHGRFGMGLGLLAYKPAPCIISYCGYLGTLGLPTVDYFFSDDVIHPPDSAERYVETLLKLPHWLAYAPPPAPAVVDRPAGAPITFCSFNQLGKLSDACLSSWAKVLDAVPEARLLIKRRDLPQNRSSFLARLSSLGIKGDRLDFLDDDDDHFSHLFAYGKADIALDTSPYNGATTVCEALWMGLPVVVRSGGTAVSRMSRSILSAAGLEYWASDDDAGFVEIARSLAMDQVERRRFRRDARRLLSTSALCDGIAFARAFEDACYRASARS